MSSAGGLFYHLRALRSARRAWAPFRSALGAWLDGWPASSALVLVGPSAGYCLPDTFLRRFDDITVLEPDPVARWLLARRLRELHVRATRFVADDLLLAPLVERRPGLDELLRTMPEASVLFANLLGQLCFLLDALRLQEWQGAWTDRVVPALEGRPWASFHDRVSGGACPRMAMPHREPSRLGDEALGARFFGHASGRVELHDHHTAGLFPPSLPHACFHWEIEPGAHHVVEGVCSPPLR